MPSGWSPLLSLNARLFPAMLRYPQPTTTLLHIAGCECRWLRVRQSFVCLQIVQSSAQSPAACADLGSGTLIFVHQNWRHTCSMLSRSLFPQAFASSAPSTCILLVFYPSAALSAASNACQKFFQPCCFFAHRHSIHEQAHSRFHAQGAPGTSCNPCECRNIHDGLSHCHLHCNRCFQRELPLLHYVKILYKHGPRGSNRTLL
jgi:hypothetical protein